MDKQLVTTGFDFQGYKITKYLSLQEGLVLPQYGWQYWRSSKPL